jgi:hypothetical protein
MARTHIFFNDDDAYLLLDHNIRGDSSKQKSDKTNKNVDI